MDIQCQNDSHNNQAKQPQNADVKLHSGWDLGTTDSNMWSRDHASCTTWILITSNQIH
jgi:hypothetical protein